MAYKNERERLEAQFRAEKVAEREAALTPELRGMGIGLSVGNDRSELTGMALGLYGIEPDSPPEESTSEIIEPSSSENLEPKENVENGTES